MKQRWRFLPRVVGIFSLSILLQAMHEERELLGVEGRLFMLVVLERETEGGIRERESERERESGIVVR